MPNNNKVNSRQQHDSEDYQRIMEDNFKKDEKISLLQSSIDQNKDQIKQIENKLITIDAKFKEANETLQNEIAYKEQEIN